MLPTCSSGLQQATYIGFIMGVLASNFDQLRSQHCNIDGPPNLWLYTHCIIFFGGLPAAAYEPFGS